jgi:hypothetical protein
MKRGDTAPLGRVVYGGEERSVRGVNTPGDFSAVFGAQIHTGIAHARQQVCGE